MWDVSIFNFSISIKFNIHIKTTSPFHFSFQGVKKQDIFRHLLISAPVPHQSPRKRKRSHFNTFIIEWFSIPNFPEAQGSFYSYLRNYACHVNTT